MCKRCYDPVLPHFNFLFTLPFQSYDFLSHGLSPDQSPDFHHMTTLFWLFIIHKAIVRLIRECLLFYLSIVLLAYCPVLLSWPLLFQRPIVRLFWTLSQVAASVVYKPTCIVERGLKPDLVFQSKCCCSSNLFCVPFSSLSISSPFGSSQGPLRLSLHLPLP